MDGWMDEYSLVVTVCQAQALLVVRNFHMLCTLFNSDQIYVIKSWTAVFERLPKIKVEKCELCYIWVEELAWMGSYCGASEAEQRAAHDGGKRWYLEKTMSIAMSTACSSADAFPGLGALWTDGGWLVADLGNPVTTLPECQSRIKYVRR